MRIYFGADHAGFTLKEKLKKFVESLGHTAIDAGPFERAEGDDYPDYVIPAVKAAVATKSKAIVLGGSGIGECVAANKVNGARAALCFDRYTAKMSRLDNDANVLCLGARTSAGSLESAKNIVKFWLSTKFSNAERHRRRLKKIASFETNKA